MTKLPRVWRANLLPQSSKTVDPREFCLTRGIVGAGWGVEALEFATWDEYHAAASKDYAGRKGWAATINALKNRMRIDDLCWTRDAHGQYYLGRITGDWEYRRSPENAESDVINFRSCEWMRIGTVEEIPGRIINSFSRGTIQEIDDETVRLFSASIYNSRRQVESPPYDLGETKPDPLALFSAEDFEDLVGLYMQLEGYLLVPSSCKRTTGTYEWVMIHKESGRRATAQVKSGSEDLVPSLYASFEGAVVLFTARGRFIGPVPENVVCLRTDALQELWSAHRNLMPKRIETWLQIAEASRVIVPAGTV
jgi:hypothetical protein